MTTPEERAVKFANTNATSMWKKALRKGLPRAGTVGWATVKAVAAEVFAAGGSAKEVEKRVLEIAAEPVEPKVDPDRIPSSLGLVLHKTPRRSGN